MPWRLIFAQGLLAPFWRYDEVISIRKYLPGSNNFTKDQIIQGHFKDGCGFLLDVLEDVVPVEFGAIDQASLNAWGQDVGPHTTHEEMMEAMYGFYGPDLKPDELAAVVHLRLRRVKGLVQPCHVPADVLLS